MTMKENIFQQKPQLLEKLKTLVVEKKKEQAQKDAPAQRGPIIIDSKIGRNDLCDCGSGKKYKKCCLLQTKT